MECFGADKQLKNATDISIRDGGGVIKVGCPFVCLGKCTAANSRFETALMVGVIKAGQGTYYKECIHGDGKRANILYPNTNSNIGTVSFISAIGKK